MSAKHHLRIDSLALATAAFWLGQLARWLYGPTVPCQFFGKLFNGARRLPATPGRRHPRH
jgi:hypothetical protein